MRVRLSARSCMKTLVVRPTQLTVFKVEGIRAHREYQRYFQVDVVERSNEADRERSSSCDRRQPSHDANPALARLPATLTDPAFDKF